MRRWNGWGDDRESYPLPSSAVRLLGKLVGEGSPPLDASFELALAAVPPSRLPNHPMVSVEKGDRLRHARGQSLPDWVDLRSGSVSSFPDGVAYPSTDEDVLDLILYAQEADVKVIPYGGGTSVLGHINPFQGDAPVLTVDLSRLRGMRSFVAADRLATFGAGTLGPSLEAELRARGFTLGHFPQSFEFSTLGGWVSTRSSGQESLGYGRIERLFAGGRLVSPSGILDIPSFPASAAGPDLREMVLGSEGRMGIFTEISVRVTSLPKREEFHALFFPDFDRGREAAREMTQEGLPLTMLRLSNAAETLTTLALAGSRFLLISAFERFLSLRGAKGEKSMMLLGVRGKDPMLKTVRKEALGIARRHKGVHAGRTFGRQWRKNRFRAPYLRNTLWEAGYAVDTLETATVWTKVPELIAAVETALRTALTEKGERVHVFTHLSHLYPYGSSIYTTYIFRLSKPEETKRRWQCLKKAASGVIVRLGGTISHHHGVGEDHLPYLQAEKSALGIEAIQNLCLAFDPKGLMNPGKLVPKRDH